MATERTPEENAEAAAVTAMVAEVLSGAVENYASWMVADVLDLDPSVCEGWVNRVWDTLRDRLDPEQRLHAIVHLMHDRAVVRARQILAMEGLHR